MVDVFKIGNCTLYSGDALAIMLTLDSVDAVVTDPPYSSGGLHASARQVRTGVKYQGTGFRHLYTDFLGDSRDQRSFSYWSMLWMSEARKLTKRGGLICSFIDWRQLPTLTDAIQAADWTWRGIVVWDKTEGVRPQQGRFRNQCEYLVWGSNGDLPIAGPVVPGCFRYSVSGHKKLHMTGKPVPLMADILSILPAGALVLDPFMGSASTGIACLQRGLSFVGIEQDPTYFKIACDRMQAEYDALKVAA